MTKSASSVPNTDLPPPPPSSPVPFQELTDAEVFAALRKTWQPVCLARDLRRQRIVSYVLLNEEIVVADLPTGLLAARDLCPHRGAKFGLGAIVGDNLQCPYHGWQFDHTGGCAKIPSLIDARASLERSCLKTFQAVERYGMIWVKLDPQELAPLPDVPEYEDPHWRYLLPDPAKFATGFRREVDNYLDMSHFAFAHKKTLGVAAQEQITDITITHFDDGFQMDAPFPALSIGHIQPEKLQSAHQRRQRCFLPNFTTIRQSFTDGDERVLVHIPSPNTFTSCTVFWALAISPNFDGPPGEKQIEFAIGVLDEDRIMVENQRPLEVPIGPEDAVMVPADRLANTYKAAIREFVIDARPKNNRSADAQTSSERESITILYGSQTGTAERLANTAARTLKRAGFLPSVHSFKDTDPSSLRGSVLIICSTYGNGDPPDNARSFYDALFDDPADSRAIDLSEVRFAVLALGDRTYANFCQCGRDLDRRLEELGARRLLTRVDCDINVDQPFAAWVPDVQRAFHKGKPQDIVALQDEDLPPGLSAALPREAHIVENRLLSRVGSNKETRHYEVDVAGAGLNYQPGDALGIIPSNSPDLVADIIHRLGEHPDKLTKSGKTLLHALQHQTELRHPSLSLIRWIAQTTKDPRLLAWLASDAHREHLAAYASSRDVLDLLTGLAETHRPTADLLLELSDALRPRLYSIASSPLVHPDSIHLTVSTVRYQANGRAHHGVTSTFLADRVDRHVKVPVYLRSNPNFHLPEDKSADIIMIGPGTGIAPFRGFLHHRAHQNAPGRNWLFFGDQSAKVDFLYEDEVTRWHSGGLLTRLSTAFSRDQHHKLYVQHRMQESARDLFQWLEAGAILYVCGDSKRMARDVDQTLHQIIESQGAMTPDAAAEYVKRLQNNARYKRDVY